MSRKAGPGAAFMLEMISPLTLTQQVGVFTDTGMGDNRDFPFPPQQHE